MGQRVQRTDWPDWRLSALGGRISSEGLGLDMHTYKGASLEVHYEEHATVAHMWSVLHHTQAEHAGETKRGRPGRRCQAAMWSWPE